MWHSAIAAQNATAAVGDELKLPFRGSGNDTQMEGDGMGPVSGHGGL